MRDIPSTTQATSVVDSAGDSDARFDAERKRLIEDLAFLVVRQHRRQQRAAPGNDPTTVYVDSKAK